MFWSLTLNKALGFLIWPWFGAKKSNFGRKETINYTNCSFFNFFYYLFLGGGGDGGGGDGGGGGCR